MSAAAPIFFFGVLSFKIDFAIRSDSFNLSPVVQTFGDDTLIAEALLDRPQTSGAPERDVVPNCRDSPSS